MKGITFLIGFLFFSQVLGFTSRIGDCISTGAAGGNGHTTNPSSGNGGIVFSGLPTSMTGTTPLTFTMTGSFKGYNIYAVDLKGAHTGTFSIVDSNTVLASGCTQTIGHNNKNTKTSISLKWTPPTPPVTVTFKGTVVKGLNANWYNLSPVTVTAPASTSTGACTPVTTCAIANAQCGTINDGCANVTCGTCTSPATCSNNKCVVVGCTPTKDCASVGQSCGNLNNGCTTVSCGACPQGENCDTVSLQCLAPLPPAVTPVAAAAGGSADPDQLPSWVGIVVGVFAGLILWAIVFIAIVMYIRGRLQEKVKEASRPVAAPSPEVAIDPTASHFAPPLWRRTLKRLTKAFASTPDFTQFENENSQISIMVPPKTTPGRPLPKVNQGNTNAKPLPPNPKPNPPLPPRRG